MALALALSSRSKVCSDECRKEKDRRRWPAIVADPIAYAKHKEQRTERRHRMLKASDPVALEKRRASIREHDKARYRLDGADPVVMEKRRSECRIRHAALVADPIAHAKHKEQRAESHRRRMLRMTPVEAAIAKEYQRVRMQNRRRAERMKDKVYTPAEALRTRMNNERYRTEKNHLSFLKLQEGLTS